MLRSVIMNFNSLFNDQATKILTIFTALSTGAGFIITNLYLGKYNICDYAIFNAKAIYTGLIFMFIVAISVVFIFAFFETRNYNDLKIKTFFGNFIVKPIYLANMFILYYVASSLSYEELPVYTIYNDFSIHSMFLYFLMVFDFTGLCFRSMLYPYIKQKDNKFGKFFDKVTSYLFFITLIPFPIMIYFNDEYKNVFYFFAYLSFLSMLYCAIERDNMVSLTNGIRPVNPSPFTKATTGACNGRLEYILLICSCFVLFFNLAGFYSAKIYPLLSEQQGGAAVKQTTILTNKGETISGKIIHREAKRYYLLVDDDVLVINLSEIHSVKGIEK